MPTLTVVLYPFGELPLEALVHCLHSLGGCSVQEFPSLVPHLVLFRGCDWMWAGQTGSQTTWQHVIRYMGGVGHAHYFKRRDGYNEL